jgi:hypothetical protein
MKLTETRLRQIIKEEVARAVRPQGLREGVDQTTINTLIEDLEGLGGDRPIEPPVMITDAGGPGGPIYLVPVLSGRGGHRTTGDLLLNLGDISAEAGGDMPVFFRRTRRARRQPLQVQFYGNTVEFMGRSEDDDNPYGDDDDLTASKMGKSPPYDPEEWRALLRQGSR